MSFQRPVARWVDGQGLLARAKGVSVRHHVWPANGVLTVAASFSKAPPRRRSRCRGVCPPRVAGETKAFHPHQKASPVPIPAGDHPGGGPEPSQRCFPIRKPCLRAPWVPSFPVFPGMCRRIPGRRFDIPQEPPQQQDAPCHPVGQPSIWAGLSRQIFGKIFQLQLEHRFLPVYNIP